MLQLSKWRMISERDGFQQKIWTTRWEDLVSLWMHRPSPRSLAMSYKCEAVLYQLWSAAKRLGTCHQTRHPKRDDEMFCFETKEENLDGSRRCLLHRFGH